MVQGELLRKVPRRPIRQGTVSTAGANWRVCREGVSQDRHASPLDALPMLPKTRDRRRTSIVEEEQEVTLKAFAQASMEDLKKAVGVKSRREGGPTIASVFMAAFWEKRRMNKVEKDNEVIEELNKWLEEHGGIIDVYRGKLHCDRTVFEDHHTSKKMPKLIFHPFHPYRLAWDVVIMILLFYSLVSVPYVVAFVSSTGCQGDFFKQSAMWYFDLSLDVFFMTDILVNFRTAYFNRRQQGKLVTESKSIAVNYLQGFFCIDLVSSMPYDVILLFACSSEDAKGAMYSRAPKIIRVIRVVRVLRLLRVSRISKFLQKLRDLLRLNPGVVRLIEFVAVILFVMHYNSCIFFFLGEFFLEENLDYSDPGKASWTVSEMVMDHDGLKTVHDIAPWKQYVVSLYWAVTTMTTMGYGDITPVTTVEVAFTILVILQGGITFSYIVGNMANLLSRINLRQLRYRESMEQWEDFMYREHLPTDLSHRIKALKQHLYLNPSRHIPRFAAQELSATLLRDITAHIFRPLLSRLPTFQSLDECSLTALALALEPLQIAPQQVLYREGEQADCMYFFHAGEIQMSMLLMTEDAKRKFGAKVIADPKVAEWFTVVDERDGRRRLNACLDDGTVLWQGLHARKHKFFRWNVTPKRKAYFGESVLSSTNPTRLATVVTKTWCSIFRLNINTLNHLSSRFPALGEVMKSLRGHTRPNPLKQMASKIIRAMRMKESSQASLMVIVEAGASLPPSDYRLSRCDPYCTVQLQPALGVEGVNRTLIQFNTSFPVWNEHFPYVVPQGVTLHEHKIKIKVYDHDATGAIDQFGLLGEGEVDLETLAKRVEGAEEGQLVEHAVWVPLWRKRRRRGTHWKRLKGRDGRGAKVHVVVKWVPAVGGAKHLKMSGVLVGDDGDGDGDGDGDAEKKEEGSTRAAVEGGGGEDRKKSRRSFGEMMRTGSARAMSMLRGVLPIGRGRSAKRVMDGGMLLSTRQVQADPRLGDDHEGKAHANGSPAMGVNGAGKRSRGENGALVDGDKSEQEASSWRSGSADSVVEISRLQSNTTSECQWSECDSRLSSGLSSGLDSRYMDSQMLESVEENGEAGPSTRSVVEELADEARKGQEEVAALHDKVKAVMEMLQAIEGARAWTTRPARSRSPKTKASVHFGTVEERSSGSGAEGIRVFRSPGAAKTLLPLPPIPRQHSFPHCAPAAAAAADAPAQRSSSSSPTSRQRSKLQQLAPMGTRGRQGFERTGRKVSSPLWRDGATPGAADHAAAGATRGLGLEVRAYLEELSCETDPQRLEEHLATVRRLRAELAATRAPRGASDAAAS